MSATEQRVPFAAVHHKACSSLIWKRRGGPFIKLGLFQAVVVLEWPESKKSYSFYVPVTFVLLYPEPPPSPSQSREGIYFWSMQSKTTSFVTLGYIISLSLSFLICKMSVAITMSLWGICENYEKVPSTK